MANAVWGKTMAKLARSWWFLGFMNRDSSMNLRDVIYTYDIALMKRKGLFAPICQCGTV